MQSTHFCDLYKASQKGFLLYATLHSYKQVTEAQTSCILPYLPSLKDTERAELFCDGSQIDGEKHSPVNTKSHQVYNREWRRAYFQFSWNRWDKPDRPLLAFTRHFCRQLRQLSFTASHTSQQAPTLDLMISSLVHRQLEVREYQLLLLSNNCMVNDMSIGLTTIADTEQAVMHVFQYSQ